MEYLSSPDLVQAFYGLNHRFNSIVIKSVRHFNIPNDTPSTSIIDCMSYISHFIEVIYFDVELLSKLSSSILLLSNLRSIFLHCSNKTTVKLNIQDPSNVDVVSSCLNILRLCNIYCQDDENETNDEELTEEDQAERVRNTLPCSAIVRLSIENCDEQDLFALCALAPNLTSLRIDELSSSSDDSSFNTIFELISKSSSHLTRLYISSDVNDVIDFNWIGKLIGCYQSSLEQLKLNIRRTNRIEGSQLQKIFEPCERLKNLDFAFQFLDEAMNILSALAQFQSEWWLDARRAPVLLFRSGDNYIFIGSMPSILPGVFKFSSDLRNWRLNKEKLDSPLIRFTAIKHIVFVNNNDQPITFNFIQFISRIFHAKKQIISMGYWEFDSSLKLLEKVCTTCYSESHLNER
ncbi:unnamed protein product [Rotaria sp. Silwood1]|nr:unnamed protein product [Rotaria sp. Silwood1]